MSMKVELCAASDDLPIYLKHTIVHVVQDDHQRGGMCVHLPVQTTHWKELHPQNVVKSLPQLLGNSTVIPHTYQ